jgi:hypothetical protein
MLHLKVVRALLVVEAIACCPAKVERERPSERTQVPVAETSAAAIMRAYVSRDAVGERLAPSAWFLSVSTWEDEPAWDAYAVVDTATVDSIWQFGDSALVRVVYDRLGRVESTDQGPDRFIPNPTRESVDFVLRKTGGEWKVARPQILPHVGVTWLLASQAIPLDAKVEIRRLTRKK